MARIFFLAFDAAGQTALVKKLRAAGHRLAQSEPRYPAFYDLLKQQAPPPDAFIVDCSQKPSHAFESCNYIRSVKAYKATPIVLYNVRKEDATRAVERVPAAIVLHDDKVEKQLQQMGLTPAASPA